jgi:hypothetical protein
VTSPVRVERSVGPPIRPAGGSPCRAPS